MSSICIITTVHPPQDIRVFHKEAVSLANAGYEVTLVATGAETGIRNGVNLVSLPKPYNRLTRMTIGVMRGFWAAFRSKAFIVHLQDPELIPAGILLKIAGRKVIYDIHEDFAQATLARHWVPLPLRYLIGFAGGLMERVSARFFDAIIAATPAIAERFRFHSRTVTVCNYPLTGEIPERTGEAPGNFIICAGVISENRGALVMLEAMGILNKKHQATLLLAGHFSPGSLRPVMEQHPGWKHVEYLGYLDRPGLASALKRASAGLVILDPEERFKVALPTKMFEYMAAGIPVIASDFPLWRQIVGESGCGLLADPTRPEAVAEAIESVLSHRMESMEMGKRGREAFLSKYNWATQESILLTLYRDLAGGTRT